MSSAKDVFISYSSKEYDRASGIRDILEKNGISVWIAPDAIPAGVDYASVIPDAIAECRVFLLLLSENSQRSKYVPKELDQAIVSERIIVPFQIDRSELTKAFDFRLKNIQRIEAYKDTADEYERLVKLIKRLVSEEDSTAFEKQSEKAQPSRGGIHPAMYALGAALMLALGAGIFAVGMSLSKSDNSSHTPAKTTAGTAISEESYSDTETTAAAAPVTTKKEPAPLAGIKYYTDYEQPEVQYDEDAPDKYDTEVTGLKMVKPLGNYIHSTKFRGFDAYLEYNNGWKNSAGNIEAGGKGIDADITGDGVYTVGISANSLRSKSADGKSPDEPDFYGYIDAPVDDEGYVVPEQSFNGFDIKIIGMWDGKELFDGSEPQNNLLITRHRDQCLVSRYAGGFFSAEQLKTLKVEVLSVKLDGNEINIDPDAFECGISDEYGEDGNFYHIMLPYSALEDAEWFDAQNAKFAESLLVTFRIEGISDLIDEMGGVPYQDFGIADLK